MKLKMTGSGTDPLRGGSERPEQGDSARLRPGFLLLTLLVAVAYTLLRFELNIEYEKANLGSFYSLNAPIPFGYRVLIPLLTRPLVWTGLTVREAFFFWEFCTVTLLVLVLYQLFRESLGRKGSEVLALGFLWFLPSAFLLQFRWPLFYPYDTPAMLMTTAGLWLMIQQKWAALIPLLFLATLNRESSLLLVLLYGVLFPDKLSIRTYLVIGLSLCGVYVLTRAGVGILTLDNPRPYGSSMAFLYRDEWRSFNNLRWISDFRNIPILLATLGFLPVLVVCLKKHIPHDLFRVHLVALAYFGMLIFVGNLYEPRVFGELLVLGYVLFGLGLAGFLSGEKPGDPLPVFTTQTPILSERLLTTVNRYGWILLLGLIGAGLLLQHMMSP